MQGYWRSERPLSTLSGPLRPSDWWGPWPQLSPRIALVDLSELSGWAPNLPKIVRRSIAKLGILQRSDNFPNFTIIEYANLLGRRRSPATGSSQ